MEFVKFILQLIQVILTFIGLWCLIASIKQLYQSEKLYKEAEKIESKDGDSELNMPRIRMQAQGIVCAMNSSKYSKIGLAFSIAGLLLGVLIKFI